MPFIACLPSEVCPQRYCLSSLRLGSTAIEFDDAPMAYIIYGKMAPQIAVLFIPRKMKICLKKRQHNCNSVYWSTCCCSHYACLHVCRCHLMNPCNVAHMSVGFSFFFSLKWGYIEHRLVACPIVFGVTSSFHCTKNDESTHKIAFKFTAMRRIRCTEPSMAPTFTLCIFIGL